jgi:DNA-binding transcriptional ArsR family regulator
MPAPTTDIAPPPVAPPFDGLGTGEYWPSPRRFALARTTVTKVTEAGAGTRGRKAKGLREISDPRTMRALAHPMRIALLEAIMREGSLTATRAAELLDDTPGNMSWHLQTLAKYGYVEEAGGGRGRSRPWRLVDVTHSFDAASVDVEHAAAEDALEASLYQRTFEQLRTWWSQRRSYPVKWRRAAFSCHATTYLTAEEMKQLTDDVNRLFVRYRDRARDKSLRPPGALPVHLVAFGHPLPPMPSGN